MAEIAPEAPRPNPMRVLRRYLGASLFREFAHEGRRPTQLRGAAERRAGDRPGDRDGRGAGGRRDGAPTPDITLQGASARGEGGQKLQRYFRDGTFAEQVRVPTENAAPIGTIDPAEAGRWCSIGTLLIAYGGLLAMDFRPGETLLVSGATGNFGSATVALAMGARCVGAPGRNAAVLDDLRQRFGERLRPVRLTGDAAADTLAMQEAAPGPIDAVQDFLPPSVSAGVARAAIMT